MTTFLQVFVSCTVLTNLMYISYPVMPVIFHDTWHLSHHLEFIQLYVHVCFIIINKTSILPKYLNI